MPWIDHPGCSNPVSRYRWLKFKVAEWLGNLARRWEYDAVFPNCEMCGQPRNHGDHSNCDELPF